MKLKYIFGTLLIVLLSLKVSTASNMSGQLNEMDIDIDSRTELLSVELPPSREAGIVVESVDELVDKLRNEAKVIQ